MRANLVVRVNSCDIPPREGRALILGGREIAIFNLGTRFLAIDNRCPHKGGPLSDGIVSANTVVCPLHAWKINLETGDRGADGRLTAAQFARRCGKRALRRCLHKCQQHFLRSHELSP